MLPTLPSASPQPYPALYLYPSNKFFVRKRIPLAGGQRVKIGRCTSARTAPSEKNGFFDSDVLSKWHAEVWEDGGKIFIRDVKSANGTFINGERLSPEGVESDPYELRSADTVEFGIDIVGEDYRTIIHHKVAARAICVFSEQDAQVATQAERQQQHARRSLLKTLDALSIKGVHNSPSPMKRGGASVAGGGEMRDVLDQVSFQKGATEVQQLVAQVLLMNANVLGARADSLARMSVSEHPELWTASHERSRHMFHTTVTDGLGEESQRREKTQQRGQNEGKEKQGWENGGLEEHEVHGSNGGGGCGDGVTGEGDDNREGAQGLNSTDELHPRLSSDASVDRLGDDVGFQESFDAASGTVWKLLGAILSKKATYKALLESTGQRAQVALDILQKSLDSEDTPEKLRPSALSAMIRLCTKSGVYPQCLELRGVRYDREPIASGSFGEVWKGHLGTRIVCLKVARVYAGSEVEDVIKSYSGEAMLWSQLNHPNVLPFYGIYRLDGRLGRVGLVSPWMRNGNATEYLKANPEVPRVSLIHDILAGLGYLHERSVVHGDLKGANILISPDGSACLADFGLSSVVNPEVLRWTSLKTMTKSGGTVRWEAPELMDELEDGTGPRPTFMSDVYSVASVMYEVLTGQVPYYEFPRDATVILRVMRGIKPTRPTLGPTLELSDEIWKVMEECWSRSPSERPTVSQVAEQLRKIPQSELTARRMAGHRMRERGEGNMEIEVLPPLSFRDAIRGDHLAFSKTEIDLLQEYQT